MSDTALRPALLSTVESNDVVGLNTFLRTPPAPNRSTLDALLARAIRHNALATIDVLVTNGASVLSIPACDALRSSSAFPSFEHLVIKGELDINLDLDWLGTILILAVKRNDHQQVHFCLKHGADPNLGFYAQRWSALATAAHFGSSLEIVEMLLASGARMEGSDVLQTAAESARVTLVKLLLEKGADVNSIGFEYAVQDQRADEAGGALHFAADAGSVDVVKLLLDNDADVGLRDVRGRTARERAVEKGKADVVLVLDGLGIAS